MFELDKAVKDWSTDLKKTGLLHDNEIAELRDHLLCFVEHCLHDGLDEEQAFDEAIEKIGLVNNLKTEYFKIGFIDRLGRLPKELVAVAAVFIFLSLIASFQLVLLIFNPEIYPPAMTTNFIIRCSIMSIFYMAIGFGILSLVSFFRFCGFAISCYSLIVLPLGSIYRISKILEVEGSLNWNIWGRFLVNDQWVAISIISVNMGLFMLIYFWFAKVLNQSEIKLLFGNKKNNYGLIRQPMKTFRWLPY